MEQKREPRTPDILSLVSAHRRCILGVAALFIYVFHKHQPIFSGHLTGAVENAVTRLLFVGVDVFLMMAGLGLCYAIRKQKLLQFWFRRFKRLALPWLLTGAAVALLEHWDMSTVFGNLSGYNFFAKNLYSFMWFFPAIATLYLLFPPYHKLLRLSGSPLVFTGVVLCIWLLASMLLAKPVAAIGRTDLYAFTNRIPIFVIGVLFGEIAHTRALRVSWLGWILLALVGALGAYLGYQTSFNKMTLLVPTPNCCVPNILMSVPIVLFCAKGFELLSRVRVGRWFRKCFDLLGAVSLELYAAQRITKIKWADPLPWSGSPVLKNLTMFLMALAIAVAIYWIDRGFWALAELPFRKQKK